MVTSHVAGLVAFGVTDGVAMTRSVSLPMGELPYALASLALPLKFASKAVTIQGENETSVGRQPNSL